MVTINGEVVRGLGAAKDTLKVQLPFFVQIIPEMSICHPASINLRLESALRVGRADCTTPPIPWAGFPGEVFSFVKVSFEFPIGAAGRPAWIYIPHGSPHLYNCFQVEVISSLVEGLSYGAICQIQIARQHKEAKLILV